jgi:hypothetical protein
MSLMRSVVVLMCTVAPVTALAGDERAEALAAFQGDAQQCKFSYTQQVSVELESVPGKPPADAATPEEVARVKNLLAESGLPFDLKDHRATFEFTLALIRAKNAAVFRVTSANPNEDLSAVHDCLAKLSSSSGLDYRFEE